MRTITLKFLGDEKHALAAINRIAAAAQKLKQNNNFSNFGGNTKTSISGQSFFSGGINVAALKVQFAEVENLSKSQRKLVEAGLRNEIKLAYEAAKQQTLSKKGEVQQFIQAEKAKSQSAVLSVRKQIQEANNAARAVENAKKREYQEFVRIERQKAIAASRTTNNANSGGIGIGGAAFAGGAVGGAIGAAIGAVTSAITSGGAALLDYSSKIEQVKISFQTLTGSASATEKLLKEIQEFAKSTPFEFAELAGLSQKLLGANVEASKVIPLIRDIGNAVSAVGGSQDDLNGVTRAITQIISLNRVQADELNQLSERNINGYKILSEQLGKTEAETRKLVESGSVSADLFLTAFQRFSQAKFGDAMQKQSQTFAGAMSNIKDTLLIAGSTYFKPLFDKISEISIATSKELENADFGQAVNILAKNIARGFGEALAVELKNEWKNIKWGEVLTIPTFNLGEEFSKGLLGDWNLYDWITGDSKAFKGVVSMVQKAISDVSKMNSTLNDTKNTANSMPDISKQLNAEKARKDAEMLKNIIGDLTLRVRFFGDESEKAAVQQRLISQGITDFSSAQARIALSLANTLDALKENQEAQKKYEDELKKAAEDRGNKLKDLSEQLLKMREDAEFELEFANPTKLQEFDRWVKENTKSFSSLTGQIQATRRAVLLLQEAQNITKRGEAQKSVIGDIQKQISALANIDTDGFNQKMREIADTLNLKGFFNQTDVNNRVRTDVTNDVFAQKVRGFIETIKILEANGASTEKVRESLAAFLRTFKTEETNSLGQQLQVFTDDKIPQLIDLFLQLARAIDTSNQKAATASYKDLLSGLDEEIASLNRELAGGIELSKADAIAKELQTEAYKNLTPEMRNTIQARAAEIDSLRAAKEAQAQIREQYEETRETLVDIFDVLTERGKSLSERLGNAFKYIADRFKRAILDMAATALTNKLFGIGGQQTGGGNIFSSIFGNIFGGGRGGGLSLPGGFGTGASGSNPNIFSFGGAVGNGRTQGVGLAQLLGLGNSSGGGFLSSVLSPQGIVGAVATAGLSVGVAALMASLQTHSPAKGALLGGLVGFVAGIFNRNNRRKREEKLRTQYINDAFSGLKAFDQLIADTRALRIQPPESALTQGQSLADNIRQTYLAQSGALKDKKTRNIALKDVSRIDGIVKQKMDELRKVVEMAQAANLKERRILPEFATGYFADFFKPNGLIPGTFDRKDDILAMISRGEMVLNPKQQNRVRQMAGFDVFAHAEIPNYPARQKNAVPKFADGAFVSGGGMQIKTGDVNVKVELHNVEVKRDSYMILQTEDGKRKVIDIYREAKKNKEI